MISSLMIVLAISIGCTLWSFGFDDKLGGIPRKAGLRWRPNNVAGNTLHGDEPVKVEISSHELIIWCNCSTAAIC